MTVFIKQLLSSSYVWWCTIFVYALYVHVWCYVFFSLRLPLLLRLLSLKPTREQKKKKTKTTNTLAVTTMPFVVAHLLSHGNCYTNYGDASSVSNMHGNKSSNEPRGEYCLFVPFACRTFFSTSLLYLCVREVSVANFIYIKPLWAFAY